MTTPPFWGKMEGKNLPKTQAGTKETGIETWIQDVDDRITVRMYKHKESGVSMVQITRSGSIIKRNGHTEHGEGRV